MPRHFYLILFILFGVLSHQAQVMYSSQAVYGLRKEVTTYNGNSIQIKRACDNATANIGFTSCGDLDTTTLKNFVLVPNPLSAMTAVSAAAYSLRKLRCAYGGNAIQVRRSSDNTTQNIGFTNNGDLDTVTLKTFVGANSAFVSIWYDQSGNGRDASQATLVDQPRIMNAGSIEYLNNRPAIRFQDNSDGLQTANFTAYAAAACFNGVAKVNTNLAGSYNGFVSKTGNAGSNNQPAPLDFYFDVNGNTMRQVTGNGTTPTFFILAQGFNAAQSNGIWTFCATLAANTASLNGSSILASAAATNFNDVGRPLNIGKRNDGVTALNGWIQEIVTFGSIPSATDIGYLQWTQSNYYSINGPVLTTLPAGAQSASVTTWYDQSGNNNNLQSIGSRQPLIMNAGRVVRMGASASMPGIQGTSASQTNLTTVFGSAYTGAVLTVNSVVRTDVNTNANWRIVSVGNAALTSADWNSNNYFNINQRNANDFVVERNGITPVVTGITVGSAMVLSDRFSGSQRQMFYNGTGSTATNDNTSFNFTSMRLLQSINPAFEATEALTGKMSEFGMYYASLSTTRRRLMESSQAAYYNIAIANGKYTPPSTTTYNRFVVGIGRENGAGGDSVAVTRESAGMGFSVTATAAGFLKDDGDYISAGINCPITNSTNTTFLASAAPVVLRWDNDWYIDKRDVGTPGGILSIYFDFGDYNIGTTPGVAANYSLLARGNTASNFTVVPTAIASVAGDRVIFTMNANAIPVNSSGTGYYTIGTTNPPVSPLPVDLVEFKAEVCEKDVCLNWKTASEINNDYFSIERSGDALNWNEIKRVKGAGNSQRTLNYSSMDYEPLPGISYYRLKQTNYDKNFKYSKIESIEFANKSQVGIYPNPNNGTLNLNNCKAYDKVTITDVLGRKVYSAEVQKDHMQLDLNTLDSGTYFIVLSNSVNGSKFTSKIIIDKK